MPYALDWQPDPQKVTGKFPGLSDAEVIALTKREKLLPSLIQYARVGKGDFLLYSAMMSVRDMMAQYRMDQNAITVVNQKHRRQRFKEENGNHDWFGFSVEETEQHLKRGWPEGAQRISQLMSKLTQLPDPISTRLKTRYGQDGEEISVDHYLDAQYDRMWRDYHRESGIGPRVLQVSFAWGGNCHLNADQLFWSGAVAAIITDLMEQAGYAIELRAWIAGTCWSANQNFLIGVTIKESDEPLNLSVLAAMAAHSGAFRHHGIQAIEFCPWDVSSGHGSIQDKQLKAHLEVVARETQWFEMPELVIEACYDEDSARNQLEQLITHINQRYQYAA